MTNLISRRRAVLAGILATAAIGTAAPTADAHKYRCDGAVERLEAKFRKIEAKRGWEAASRWWEKAWARYHDRCVV
ncbi:MAG TPA: hypothetical protein VFZ00_29685 [Solirubrobacter sp.]|jgi:hypothetical protein|nr:hypothetical protein [Solirubrobacter sp.]